MGALSCRNQPKTELPTDMQSSPCLVDMIGMLTSLYSLMNSDVENYDFSLFNLTGGLA